MIGQNDDLILRRCQKFEKRSKIWHESNINIEMKWQRLSDIGRMLYVDSPQDDSSRPTDPWSAG